MSRLFVSMSLGWFVIALAFAQAQKALTNEDVVQMVKAGFHESVIIKAIEANGCVFDSSLSGLLALKEGGVGDKIIESMLASQIKDKQAVSPTRSDSAPALVPPAPKGGDQDPTTPDLPTIYVEEVSSEGGDKASPDTTLEVIKTLQREGMRVVTNKDQADYILQVTRQLGKKSWKKDTKVVLANRAGEVVFANSTRSVGGAMGDVIDFIRKRSQ